VRGAAARVVRARARPACACAILSAALLAGGCGAGSRTRRAAVGDAPPAASSSTDTTATTGAHPPTTGAAAATPAPAAAHTKAASHPPLRGAGKRALLAHVDVVSDRVLAEGKVHIAQGAPSDAEVRREIEAARKHGAKLPAGESVAAFEAAAAQSAEPAPDAITPLAPWNPRSKPIAAWIVPVLEWAVEHGWHGSVTSGYRTYYEQAQLNAAGLFSAPAGFSNHESTIYPGGAVDVTEPGQLLAVLKGYAAPRRLVGGVLGPADPEHFSATGL
jgi:hypothetical protein